MTPELQDTAREQGTDSIPAKHAEEENGNSFGQLSLCVPGGQGVDCTGNVPCFTQSQKGSRHQEAVAVSDYDLHRCYQTEDEYLTGNPFPWTNLSHSRIRSEMMNIVKCGKHDIPVAAPDWTEFPVLLYLGTSSDSLN
jgi:hypothetical protein